MHLIVDYVPDLPKVNGVNNFVVSVFFIPVQVLGLAAMTYG